MTDKKKFVAKTNDIVIAKVQLGAGSEVAWWLSARTPDPEVGDSSPTRVKSCCVLEQGTFTPQKYW